MIRVQVLGNVKEFHTFMKTVDNRCHREAATSGLQSHSYSAEIYLENLATNHIGMVSVFLGRNTLSDADAD